MTLFTSAPRNETATLLRSGAFSRATTTLASRLRLRPPRPFVPEPLAAHPPLTRPVCAHERRTVLTVELPADPPFSRPVYLFDRWTAIAMKLTADPPLSRTIREFDRWAVLAVKITHHARVIHAQRVGREPAPRPGALIEDGN